MISIHASGQEVEIEGTRDELLEVSLTITSLIASGEKSVVLPADAHDPKPYELVLSEFAITRNSSRTLVAVDGKKLIVSGRDESLAAFSTWFRFPNALTRLHVHFEPLPDDPDHSEDSVALVVSAHPA